MMGIPFFLRTPYTPRWCMEVVSAHPLGTVLEGLEAFCRRWGSRLQITDYRNRTLAKRELSPLPER